MKISPSKRAPPTATPTPNTIHIEQDPPEPDISSFVGTSKKNKMSRLDTNESRVSDFNTGVKGSNKRIKTEMKHSMATNSDRNPARDSDITKRLKTDLTERAADGNSFVHHRFQDEYNTASLAELLEFRGEYGDLSEEETGLRRKFTQGSRVSESRPGDSEAQSKNKPKDYEDEEEDELQVEQQKSNKVSKPSVGSQLPRKHKNSIQSSLSYDNQADSSSMTYTLGPSFSFKKQHESTNMKKRPKIRSFSLQEKAKMLTEAKYTPSSEEELRMEARFLKIQVREINEIRQTEEMKKMLAEYRNSKKLLLQQTMRKLETNSLLSRLRQPAKETNERMKPSLSLPRLKTMAEEYHLPEPHPLKFAVEQTQLQATNQVCLNMSESMSITKHHYIKKQQNILKIIKQKQHEQSNQTQDIIHIESVLRSKGLKVDFNTVRRGLVGLPKGVDDGVMGKFQMPKNLVSNPKYQKFPL